MRPAVLVAAAALALLGSNLAAGQDANAPAAPERSPEALFAASCAFCHAQGGWGTRVLAARVPEGEAELLARRNLPAQYTTFVVRHGIGSMPQLTPTDLSDEELERLARWLDERN